MKETGKQGLTKQVTKFLQIMEGIYPICWYRNHQTLGSRKGRPDFEIILDALYLNDDSYVETIYIELKIGNNKLSNSQLKEQQRIEKAGAQYHICRSLEDVAQIFYNHGYTRFEIL